MLVFSPNGSPQQLDSMAPSSVNHSKKIEISESAFCNGTAVEFKPVNSRVCWLELHSIAFMLSSKQENFEYLKSKSSSLLVN